jgi:hypothetical protein
MKEFKKKICGRHKQNKKYSVLKCLYFNFYAFSLETRRQRVLNRMGSKHCPRSIYTYISSWIKFGSVRTVGARERRPAGWLTGRTHFIPLIIVTDSLGVYKLQYLRRCQPDFFKWIELGPYIVTRAVASCTPGWPPRPNTIARLRLVTSLCKDGAKNLHVDCRSGFCFPNGRGCALSTCGANATTAYICLH